MKVTERRASRKRHFQYGLPSAVAPRVFLSVLLFDIVFRSFTVCFPWAEWGKDLDMQLMPARLATPGELERRRARGEDGSRLADLEKGLVSVVQFLDPRPGKETREKL